MAVYVTEDELKEEIEVLQNSLRLTFLDKVIENPELLLDGEERGNPKVYKYPRYMTVEDASGIEVGDLIYSPIDNRKDSLGIVQSIKNNTIYLPLFSGNFTENSTLYVYAKDENGNLIGDKCSSKIKKVEIADIEDIKKEISDIESKGFKRKHSKEKFGTMILMIVERLAKKSNFAGYTWKDDFYSNALEKILSYALTNIDLDMISKRSKQRVKIFAYITQISSNAFLEVINQRKQEQTDMMEKIIPFEDFYAHVKQYYNPVYDKKEEIKEDAKVKLRYVESDEGIKLVRKGLKSDRIIGDFTSVYDILSRYRNKVDKIEIVYPESYKMLVDEYDKVVALDYKFLNVHRDYDEGYKPSFPKRQKKDVVDKFLGWE